MRRALRFLFTLALLGGLACLAACRPTPGPSPQPNSHPAPTDPRKADIDPRTTVPQLERFG